MAAAIITKRLKLRSPGYSDLNEMIEMDMSQDVQKHLFLTVQSTGEQTEKALLRKRLKESIKSGDPKGGAQWTIVDKNTGRFIGMISLELTLAINKMALSFRLKPEMWRQGYATEAVSAAVEFAFNKLMFSELSALVHPDNIASQRVIEKAGFLRDGLLFGGVTTAIHNSLLLDQNKSINAQGSISYLIYNLKRYKADEINKVSN
jgi:ribosomal-protein-alanine N-acetyltransferase